MGILDRIAGTLEDLTGEADAAARDEVARAEMLAAGGEPDAAAAILEPLVRRTPPFAPAHLALGRLRLGTGALEDAVAALGKAVDLDGDNPEGWAALGDALTRLGRLEPARDALRRALTLGLDAGLRGRAYATLGRVHARSGGWTAAARAQRKAIELLPAEETDREVALDYGRTLRELEEPDATAWLTRAARIPDADPHVFIEAAAATGDDPLAERLLREGLEKAPQDRPIRAALARRLARMDRAEEAIALAEACVAEAPEDLEARRALRETYARTGRWRDALAVAEAEGRLGAPPAFEERVRLALGAEDRVALAALAAEPAASLAPEAAACRAVLEAFVGGQATDDALVRLGQVAPTHDARRFVARESAPPPPPAGSLAGVLAWTHELASRSPALVGLAAGAAHAVEALDRPLLVAVMGEFNAGKSSFVNALCGEEVAATGVTPTTATVNVLRYGMTPEARVVRHDGTIRPVAATDVVRVLTQLSEDDLRAIRFVEVFLPVETLRRIEVVDTPGLNSIRPEHERVARDFLEQADAIVWVFSAGQAAKATEKEALSLAHGAGKRVIGVLNKVDRADKSEIDEVTRHVARSLGDLVETIVPLSATRALAARKAGNADADFDALTSTLETRFFGHARELKRSTALLSLRRFLAAAAPIQTAARAADRGPDFTAAHQTLDALRRRLEGALDAERVALRARIAEGYRRAATEVREFVRPRSWLFGEHRATPADEEFLGELLEDAVTRATSRTRQSLVATLAEPATANGEARPPEPPALPAARLAAEQAVDGAIARFAAYARGVIEGGAVPDFFRHHLPRLRLDVTAIRDALTRRAPDPEEALFTLLRRELETIFRTATRDLETSEIESEMRALLHTHRLLSPLESLEQTLSLLSTP